MLPSQSIQKYLCYTLLVLLLGLLTGTFFKGVFFDGLTYATISRNLANGNGSLFYVHFTELEGHRFTDNLPLFFWFESVFFTLFGDHFWTEKICCLVLILLTISLSWSLIKVLGPNRVETHGWGIGLIMLYLLNPGIIWVFSNNMVECLLIPLVIWFVLLFYKQKQLSPWLFYAGSVLILCAILLTKGPLGIFVLGVFPLWGLLHKDFFASCLKGIVVVLLSLGILTILYFLSGGFKSLVDAFFHHQLVKSLNGDRETSGSHINFLVVYANHFLLPFILAALFLIRRGLKGIKTTIPANAYVFLGIGLLQPAMFLVTVKQNDYYFSVSYIFFYLFFGLVFSQELLAMYQKISAPIFYLKAKVLNGILITLCLSILLLQLNFYGSYQRNQSEIEDAAKISNYFKQENTIPVDHELVQDWQLFWYLQRNHKKLIRQANESDTVVVSLAENTREGIRLSKYGISSVK